MTRTHTRQIRTLASRSHILMLPAVATVLLLTALVYWPGLAGGFTLDDFPNLVDNAALTQGTLAPASLWKAAFSMDAGPTGRPLSMLSFALETRIFGLDPWVMKLTNLGIHLLNGLLVFLLLRRILRLGLTQQQSRAVGRNSKAYCAACSFDPATMDDAQSPMAAPSDTPAVSSPARGDQHPAHDGLRPNAPYIALDSVALVITAAWLLSPINLTGVLYVVQRMESFAALFMLLGLLAYVIGRERMRSGQPGGMALSWAGIAGGTALGVLAKESAAMLPVYALLLEATLFHGRDRDGRIDRRILVLFIATLIVPALLGLAWLLPGILSGAAYAHRPFDLAQRLWTEGRALWSYIGWTLAPHLKSLSLYHDAYPLSTGWLHPLTTLPAALGLTGLLGLGLWLIRRRPLIALGILWFLGGHLLVSSILPLELVYEHRNYLPSIGLLLALFSLILLEPPKQSLKTARLGFVVCLIVLSGFLTFLRANTWGNPLLLAATEAARQPDSPRAHYQLGQILTVLAPDPSAPQFALGMQSFEDAADLPLAGLLPAQALIFLSAKHGLPINPQWWRRMRRIIATRPLAAQDISALYALIDCRIQNVCHFDEQHLGRTLAFAVKKNPRRATVLTLYANYAANIAHDYHLAHDLMQRTVALAPTNAQFWKNLVTLQIALGQKSAARTGLERIGELNRFGSQKAVLTQLQAAYALKFGHALPPALSSP